MSESRAAYRYALAVVGLAEELNQFDAVGKDFEYLADLVRQSREFVAFLRSPVINKERKNAVFAEILKSKVTDLTFNFVRLLTAKGREMILSEIIVQFSKIRDERLGILRTSLRAAVPLTPEQERQLVDHLERVTKKDVRLQYVQDKGLIGGFLVQYEDTVWDGSVRHQLELLRRRFTESGK